jgi:hypothetical protein
MKNKLKFICLFAVVSVVLSFYFYHLPVSYAAYDQNTAQTYLLAYAGSPWATMGLAALGAQNIPSDYLKNITGTKAIDFEAPILVITSINQDPRTFGDLNLIDKLKTFYSSGQIGDSSTLNDDIFGILALLSAGVPMSDPVIAGSKSFFPTPLPGLGYVDADFRGSFPRFLGQIRVRAGRLFIGQPNSLRFIRDVGESVLCWQRTSEPTHSIELRVALSEVEVARS